ncbi:MAG: hypothetical protein EOO20_00955 [Chryseobacterium sp.]|nr:MAG: hypothetical protein EOO20_00955 [Chryseobacterium sp.]
MRHPNREHWVLCRIITNILFFSAIAICLVLRVVNYNDDFEIAVGEIFAI